MKGFCLAILLLGSASASELIVMRHGYATHNRDGFHSANPEHPNYRESHVTEWGKLQVRMSATRLKERGVGPTTISKVYVSPMPRTLETVGILIEQGVIDPLSVEVHPLITESCKGELEGVSHSFSKILLNAKGKAVRGVESASEIYQRVSEFWSAVQPVKGNVLVVTHGTPARLLIRRVSGKKVRFKTASFHVARLDEKAVPKL